MGETLMVSLKEGTKQIGIAEKTGRNWLTDGKFPIPTHLIGRRRMIRVADLEDFVAGLGSKILQPESYLSLSPATEIKRRRGRPRKTTSTVSKLAGGSVNE